MTRLTDLIRVNERFEPSINIEFDLDSADKLTEYLPTSDVCEILGDYLDDVAYNRNQSTQLIGAYGKGKSFLLLAILQILFGAASAKSLDKFISRVEVVDPDLVSKIKNHKSYIPIVISPSFGSMKQAFMNGLRSGLMLAHCEDLVPYTAYEEAARLLSSWKKDRIISSTKFDQCNLKKGEVDRLINDLRSYSEQAFKRFGDIYRCITSGGEFNPILASDPIGTYKAVASSLKKRGFDGLFVVFDEFSKFLESSPENHGDELRFIQDFAELSNRSDSNYSIHFCCIAHKKTSLYSKDDRVNEILQAVEGRFVFRQFDRALKESAELINFAIEKLSAFNAFFADYIEKNKDYFGQIDRLGVFSKAADGIDAEKLSSLVFPLNPLSTFALLRINEEVAQNERTLFTFIYGSDPNGLRSLVEQDNNGHLIGIDSVWDYFEKQIFDSPDHRLKNLAYSCDATCSKYDDAEIKKIVKGMAVCLMLQPSTKLKANAQTLALALDLPLEEVLDKISLLEKEGAVRVNRFDGGLDFAFVGSKEINARAEKIIRKELRRYSPVDALKEIFKDDYVASFAYNVQKRMTRYARITYIDSESFLALSSFKDLYGWPYDGIIVRIFDASGSPDSIMKKVKEINDPKIIVQVPNSLPLDAMEHALSLWKAYERMETDAGLSNNDKAALHVMKSRLQSDIRAVIGKAYKDSGSCFFSSVNFSGKTASEILSSVFEKVYSDTPIVNNELLNRDHPTKNYAKARDRLIDILLTKGDNQRAVIEETSESSPENTIYRIFFEKAKAEGDPYGINAATKIVEGMLNGKDAIMVSVSPILQKLIEPPYGIRQGVIPLFITLAVLRLGVADDKAFGLYFGKKEEEFSSAGINKAISSPKIDEWKIKIDRGAKERSDFITGVISLFGGKAEADGRSAGKKALDCLKNWFRNLPQVVRTATAAGFPMVISKEKETFLAELTKYDLSPNDFFFEFLPRNFKVIGLDKLLSALEKEKKSFEEMETKLAKSTSTRLLSMPGIAGKKGSLLSILQGIERKAGYSVEEGVGDFRYNQIAKAIYESKSHFDPTLIDELSIAAIDLHFSDWNGKNREMFFKTIEQFLAYLVSDKFKTAKSAFGAASEMLSVVDESKLSPVSNIVENQIREILSQYNQALSKNDLLYVFGNLLKESDK